MGHAEVLVQTPTPSISKFTIFSESTLNMWIFILSLKLYFRTITLTYELKKNRPTRVNITGMHEANYPQPYILNSLSNSVLKLELNFQYA